MAEKSTQPMAAQPIDIVDNQHEAAGADSPSPVSKAAGTDSRTDFGTVAVVNMTVPVRSTSHHQDAVSVASGSISSGMLWDDRMLRWANHYLAVATEPEEVLRRDDARFRKFVQAIDKTLLGFENVSDWADIFAFLAKLSKTIVSYPQYTTIPRKLVLAKRLAQCLNPALPTGVHQKVLEVYDQIFCRLGPALADDLPTYSSGLFPLLQYASTTIKPMVLRLLEKYYVPLGTRLKPCLKSMLLTLLRCVDDEHADHFEQTMALLDSLRGTINDTVFFYSCMWMCLMQSQSVRTGAVTYLSRRMPNLGKRDSRTLATSKEAATEEPLAEPDDGHEDGLRTLRGDNVGFLMARAFAATIQDKEMLAVRSMLDLLTIHFPLHHGYAIESKSVHRLHVGTSRRRKFRY